MREIKFRGKSIRYRGWLYGDLIRDNIGGCYVYPIESKNFYKQNEVFPNSVGQYTGLKDKNGKAIYEGDIVKSIGGKIGYVVFLAQEMGYVVVWDNCDTRLGHRNRGGGYGYDLSIEVIGNVFDNEELLKK